MSYKGREIEIKLAVRGHSLNYIADILQMMYRSSITRTVHDTSSDTYYSIRNPDVRADFLRIRERGDGTTEITVKAVDRDSNLDRMEIDIHSTSKSSTIRRLLSAALGKPAGLIEKTYYVYWLDEHTTISAYQLTRPSSSDIVYIEIESTEADRVLALEAQVLSKLSDLSIICRRAEGSLYEMYIASSNSISS